MVKINKTISEYTAVFEPAREGGYNVSFPAFPGCITYGRNFEQAKANAKKMFELWLKELAAQGKKILIFSPV